ncbi:MAG: hypothetical protein A2X36_06240 [Elusimicrobia bacterium GWA2_69_24]|nr:MAG: hypothetical protein A2X36_06240 [Elusimicrobia bacterium GWA2_69_24]
MTAQITFFDLLSRAADFDDSVQRDCARLLRKWLKQGRMPGSWTVRWHDSAAAILREAAGLDVVRPGAQGGLVIDLRLLAGKLEVRAIQKDLMAFVEPGPSRDQERTLAAIERAAKLVSSEESLRWLDECRARERSGTLRMDAGDLSRLDAVVLALNRLGRRQEGAIHCSRLGALVGVSSKFFRRGAPGRRLLADALLYLSGNTQSSDDAREAALDAAGLLLSPTAYTVLVAGPLAIGSPPLDFPAELAARDEACMLTLQNLGGARLKAGVQGVVTVENEAPFLSLLAEGMHHRFLLVYTGGFAGRAVNALLERVLVDSPRWLHWGDTDLAGIRIARLLADTAGRAPVFFRCDAAEVRRLRRNLTPFSPAARKDIARELKEGPGRLGEEVLRACLAEGGWLEQEAWEALTR